MISALLSLPFIAATELSAKSTADRTIRAAVAEIRKKTSILGGRYIELDSS